MYTTCPDQEQLHASLRRYLEGDEVSRIGFDSTRKCYTYKRSDGMTISYGGLLSKLRQCFYPFYKDSRRRGKTQKKGSSAKLGSRIDDEVALVTASKLKKNKRNKTVAFHKMTVRLVKEIEQTLGHIFQCAQLPVRIRALERITQADFLTLDPATGKLHMWELKTGYTPGMYTTKGKGVFASSYLKGVKCTKYGIWELQRYWTTRALIEAGLEIAESHVINIYEDTKKKRLVVNIMDNLPWTSNLDEFGVQPSKKRSKK